MKKRIALIGCGKLGSRHLQSLIKLNYRTNIYLVDPKNESINVSLNLIENEVSPGVDEAAYVKAAFLKDLALEKTKTDLITPQKSIEILAVELLQIYAAREKIKGNSYKKSSDWYKVLEESFEFIETADQIKAIDRLLRDRGKPVSCLSRHIFAGMTIDDEPGD